MKKRDRKLTGYWGIGITILLVTVFILVQPVQTANADLATLKKFGNIISSIANIHNIVTNIQNMVSDIQGTVNNIFNEVTDSEHGLAEIKREVRNIEGNTTQILGNVTSAEFGLAEIKREVRNIEGNVTDTLDIHVVQVSSPPPDTIETLILYITITYHGEVRSMGDSDITLSEIEDTASLITTPLNPSEIGSTNVFKASLVPSFFGRMVTRMQLPLVQQIQQILIYKGLR